MHPTQISRYILTIPIQYLFLRIRIDTKYDKKAARAHHNTMGAALPSYAEVYFCNYLCDMHLHACVYADQWSALVTRRTDKLKLWPRSQLSLWRN